ncbi:hypothetical protein DFP72DRAFT_213066 [Ephemerocybe angulata]|uniref:Uncharacterized protein n=1 Tax=Ephemerocybe angulata TaxID=980116 RepID=A0A8H6I3U1_9AGAR|nr:hypothetical protein DFP72DRAFT_213066 [Tulosesus angulatus]
MSTVTPDVEVEHDSPPLKKLRPPPGFLPTPREHLKGKLELMIQYQEDVEREIEKLDPEVLDLQGDPKDPATRKAFLLFDAKYKLKDVIPGLQSLQEEVDNYVPGSEKDAYKEQEKWKELASIEYDDAFDAYLEQRMKEITPLNKSIVHFHTLQMEGILPLKEWQKFLFKKPRSSQAGDSESASVKGESIAATSGSSSVEEVTPIKQNVELPIDSSFALMNIQDKN